jgi:hypothetical protein
VASILSARLVRPLSRPLDDVHIDCLHGLDASTVETIIFRNQTEVPDGNYELVEGNGVPLAVGVRRLGA